MSPRWRILRPSTPSPKPYNEMACPVGNSSTNEEYSIILHKMKVKFLFVAALVCVGGCVASMGERGDAGSLQKIESLPRIVIEDPVFLEYDAGELRFRIQAKEARYFEGERRVLISSVRGEFQGEGPSLYQWEGGEGEIDLTRSNVEVKGGVKMWSEEGMELRTDLIFYRGLDRVIEAPGHVQWRGKEWTSESDGAIVHLAAKELSLPKDVHAEIQGEKR